uniref:Uncharacterized protein n=1 Tax=Rhizophora mucronata TaxID=61149 RepID=A0A2P2Q4X3_RHIMU
MLVVETIRSGNRRRIWKS